MISLNNFDLEKIIGKGSYGTVYRAKNKLNNNIYAIKKMSISNIKHYDTKYIINEIKFLASHNCSNIIKYYTIFSTINDIYIVTEYASSGDIFQLIKKNKSNGTRIKESYIWHYFTQISFALQYLHKNNVLHRDIKSANIFIDKNNNIKLGDFGVVKIMYYHMLYAHTQIGTPYYMSPEIYKRERYTTKSDVWSLGCVLYELMSLTQPFIGENLHELKYKIFAGRYSAKNITIYTLDMRTLLRDLLNIYPYSRPSIDDVLNKPSVKKYLQSINENLPHDFKIKTIFNENCIIPRRPTDWNIVIKKYCNNNLINVVPLPVIKQSIPLYKDKTPVVTPLLPQIKKPVPPVKSVQPISTPKHRFIKSPVHNPAKVDKKSEPPRIAILAEPKRTRVREPTPPKVEKNSDYTKPIMSNSTNREFIKINKEILILDAEIDEIKKILDMKFCRLEYYKKRKNYILDNNIENAENAKPLLNNLFDKPTYIPNSNLLVKIGSKHEHNYFLKH